MIVFRITNSLYKDDISGEGAKILGARWNSPGISMLYTSQHISLCTLEMLVHVGFEGVRNNYHLLHIYIPDDSTPLEITASKMKTSWQDDEEYTNFIGDQFINNKEALLLKVPSAVIIEENNYLVNTLHKDFKKVKISVSKKFSFDKRLASFK